MTKTDMKIDALIEYILAKSDAEYKAARKKLQALCDGSVTIERDAETVIRALLLEMGAPDHLVGHPYTVQATLLAVQDRKYIDNITFGLYPQLAAMFDTTASRVERAIRHLIEVIFTRCDYEIINRYFGNSIHPDKGKPTNSEFIARMANVVKLQLKQ